MSAEQQEADGVGRRVRAVRKLAGLTQEQLAHRAHVSVSLVRHVEQGRAPASPFFVAAVARALQVSTPELYDQPVPRFGAERAGVAELENTIMAGSAVAADATATDLDDVADRSSVLLDLRLRAQYDRVTTALPALLADTYALLATATGDDARRAWRLLAELHLHALTCLYRLGSPVATQAADIGVRAAEHADDPVLASIITVDGTTPLLQRGAFGAVEIIAARARSMVDDCPDSVATRSARGFAHLRSAIVAARSGDGDTSTEHLDIAGRYARTIPMTANVHGKAFNIDNVTIHSVSAAVEAADGAEALRRQQPLNGGATPARIGHHRMELARAHLLVGDRDGTLAELNAAREAAPQLTRYHPQVHETVRVLAETDRRRTDTLAGLAKWLGVAV